MTLHPHKQHKQLKPGGAAWQVLEEVTVGKQLMLPGYTVRECADGW